MEFKKCSIAGTIFEEADFDAMLTILRSNQPQSKYIREFLTLLSVCQTVVPDTNHDDFDEQGKVIVKYQAASPDEGALVRGAQKIGFEFTTRTPQWVHISALGEEERYELLHVLEFTSDRKRMSVIVRTPDGTIKLYIKGADAMIYDRLVSDQFATVTEQHLSKFARDGLRTLCVAVSVIPPERYQVWSKQYHEALTSTSGAAGMSREDYINELMDEVEGELELIGATAIEDKLQDGVPQTIDTLLRAGIHLWVLTGDKQETAINIGKKKKTCLCFNLLFLSFDFTISLT
jgi:phospholipid-transporting ATPase